MKKVISISFVLCLGLSLTGNSQLVLGRQVVGTVGINGATSTTNFSTTAGEPAVQSYESASYALTEGFEQPAFEPLEVVAVVVFEECWNGNNASIQLPLLSGCGGVENIFLNGEPASFTMQDLAPGNYLLEVSAIGGCTYTEVIVIETPNLPPCDLNVYNVLTPNGDGENDTFTIGNIQHPSYANNSVKILNRWGQIIWEGKNYDNVSVFWDGRNQNGEVLPQGTYFYEITIAGESFTGFVTLLP